MGLTRTEAGEMHFPLESRFEVAKRSSTVRMRLSSEVKVLTTRA